MKEAVLEKIRHFDEIITHTEGRQSYVKSLQDYIMRLQSCLRFIEKVSVNNKI